VSKKYLVNPNTKDNNRFTNRIEGLIEITLLMLEKSSCINSNESSLFVKQQIDILVRLIIFDSKCQNQN
jgi:hypothetical protein